MPDQNALSRRQFLWQTFAYSALAATDLGALGQALPDAPRPDASAAHMLLLGDWGTDRYLAQQTSVARAMQGWTDANGIHPGALFMLGDNWYGPMWGGLGSQRWQTQFEQMYPVSHFPGPAYAVLGNHDYEKIPHNKVDLQLEYGRSRSTRWTLPSRWYTFQYPAQNPVITFICLDSNLPGTKGFEFIPGSFLMSHEEAAQQNDWFRAELAKPRTTPFLAVIAHHPLYTNGIHRDNPVLISQWDALLRQAKVDLYMTGHDHDLQHLEFSGHPTSFVISGGGGAELNQLVVSPQQRGPWGQPVLGFSDLELTVNALTLRHIGADGRELHVFRRYPGGRVELLKGVAG